MKTGSFRTFEGKGGINIARRAQRGFEGLEDRRLAPGPWFMSVDRETYERKFAKQLERLDAQEVYDELIEMADGHEPVLLCWEVPPFHDQNWCHRRLVAEWFESELGIEVDEMYTRKKKIQKPKKVVETLFEWAGF